jgi:hypothetical protein
MADWHYLPLLELECHLILSLEPLCDRVSEQVAQPDLSVVSVVMV